MRGAEDPSTGPGGTPATLRFILVWMPALLMVLLLSTHLLFFLDTSRQAMMLPWELDYGEGPLAHQASLLARGEPIYTPLDTPPLRVANYPPVFPGLAAAFSLTGMEPLASGRTVSLIATVSAALALGGLAWAASVGVRKHARVLGAVVAGLLFLAQPMTVRWGCLARIDLLALAWALAGALVFALARQGWGRALLCSVLLLLAVFTRQSEVAAALAVLITAARLQKSQLPRLVVPLILLGAGALATLLLLTSGAAWENLVVANANAFSLERTASMLAELAGRAPVPLVGGAVFALLWRRTHRGEHPWTCLGASLLATYLGTAFLVSLSVGKIGSNVNYLLELLAVACAATGALVAMLSDRAGRRPGTWGWPWLVAAVALLGSTWPPRTTHAKLDTPAVRVPHERVVAFLRELDGPVLAEDTTLLLLAGRPLLYQPFEYNQLHRQGLWDQAPILRAIEQRELALIVLNFQLDHPHPYALDRFSGEQLAAMRSHYQLIGKQGYYHLYAPASPPGERPNVR